MYVHHPSNHEPAADQAKRAQENFTLSYARLLSRLDLRPLAEPMLFYHGQILLQALW